MSYYEFNKSGKDTDGRLQGQYGFPHAIRQHCIHPTAKTLPFVRATGLQPLQRFSMLLSGSAAGVRSLLHKNRETLQLSLPCSSLFQNFKDPTKMTASF